MCIAAELMASHNSLDPAARSSTAPVDVRFPPGAAAAAAARQQQLLVDQLQQQQQQQRLLSSLGGILSSSGLPLNANQLQVCINKHSHQFLSVLSYSSSTLSPSIIMRGAV